MTTSQKWLNSPQLKKPKMKLEWSQEGKVERKGTEGEVWGEGGRGKRGEGGFGGCTTDERNSIFHISKTFFKFYFGVIL